MTANPVPSILSTLRTEQATSPALIWYGEEGERVELSGRVLDNWVAKTSNFAIDELDVEPGTIVQLELPVHWKALVWALAAWQTGCILSLSAASGAGVRVTTAELEPQAPGELVVAVALPALAMAWPGSLPPGAVDYTAEVRSFADTYTGPELPAGNGDALVAGPDTEAIPFSALPAPAAGGPQVLLAPAEAGLEKVLGAALQTWSTGGTIVLSGAGVQVPERTLTAERVTARLEA
ncbi:TIGR03089 family protein [Arthrobacter sp. Sa2CUA1]|uniref:TIGR03089 family protein n=1 Tax=Arthrobacter gallicola TaxID=2762225 RepID=A0ABR8UU98_9MICC|nr:TIGR03089 family protein [Arthrobacter gallicola]MBD7996127.1 TIGR03089 family protein [Arthrobacter gallicola]